MSFAQLSVRRLAVSRTSIVPVVLSRSRFSTTSLRHKSATEAAKDTLKTVDRVVSDKLVDGIDIGTNAAKKVREVAETVQGQATGKAAELQGKAAGKAAEAKGTLKGKASEAAGEVQKHV